MIITEVTTDGLMSQLGEEVVESYDTGESGAPIGDIVTALLALQRKSTKITEGTISVTGDRAISVTNRTILSVLLQLQESIGGYMYVDTDRQLQWPTTIGEDKGQQIRYRKNLIGMTRDIDYGGYCTKLHPTSSDESLSDLSVGPVDVDVDTDATYAYLTLKEQYAAYKDWAEVGVGLPANVLVWKKNAAPTWIVPSSVDSAPSWTNSNDARDNDWDTDAESGAYSSEVWTPYITMSIADAWYEKVKWKLGEAGLGIQKLNIDVYDGAAWTTIKNGYPNHGPQELAFAGQRCTKVRLRAQMDWYSNPAVTGYWKLYECHLYQSDVTDDSSNWKQGAFENIVRAAILDYDAGATYQISYQYANYLMAWDKIVDADDIVARVVTNKYEAYAISLLEAAILMLDELKAIPITYKISAVDLSKSEDLDFSFDALQLGSVLTVIDEELGIEVSVRVITLTHSDLHNPQEIELELSTRVRDISDYLADLEKRFG